MIEVVSDFAELPVDLCDPEKDLGDLPPWEREIVSVASKLAPLPMTAKKKVVVAPLRRVIHLGVRGSDQVAVKRALAKAHYMGWRSHWAPWFGITAVNALKKFQKKHGLKPDGQYGPATHRKLLRHFDAWGGHLMQSFHPGTPEDKRRAKAVAIAMFCYHHAPRHYTQDMFGRSPYLQHVHYPHMWNSADCSGFVLWDLSEAGVSSAGPKDGWTGSMLEHGRHISVNQAKPGDSIFYNNHVAMKVAEERVVTHGHEGGPFFESMYYRSDLITARDYF